MSAENHIVTCKMFLRDLRKTKGSGKTMSELQKSTNMPCSTVSYVVEELVKSGLLVREAKDGKRAEILIYPDLKEKYAGVYISKDKIQLYIINIFGEEIYSKSSEIKDSGVYTLFYSLEEILKTEQMTEVKALAICSDNYIDHSRGTQIINQTLCLAMNLRDDMPFLPEGIEFYYAKTCVTNAWKWYDEFNITDDELNVVISFYEKNCYYSIMKNGEILRKNKWTDIEEDNYFEEVIRPICKVLKPNRIVLIVTSANEYELKRRQWHYELMNLHAKFENERTPTQLTIVEMPNPSQGAALYAMYRHYGWGE